MKMGIVLSFVFFVVGVAFAKNNIFAPPPVVVKKPEENVIVNTNNPLQRYRLEAYQLKGIVVTNGWRKAVVVSPDKRTFFVQVGDYLGNRGERIVDIRPDAIVLKRGKETITIALKKKSS
jgi:Tfp pilus assembly protein PilP